MIDPKEVARAYGKDEFPELTKALDGYSTEIPEGWVEVDMQTGPQFDLPDLPDLPDFSALKEPEGALMNWLLSDKNPHGRSGKSSIAQMALMKALKERLQREESVVVVYMGPMPLPSWVEALKSIEGVTVKIPGDEGQVVSDPVVMAWDEIDNMKFFANKIEKIITKLPDFNWETKPRHEKKSQSTNPCDRWIKPKKLRRTKGRRK